MTLDQALLAQEMRRLWDRVRAAGEAPDAVVGIATGGLLCARHLQALVGTEILSCAMRRAGTAAKRRSALTRLLARLPYPLTDELRRLEDRALERRARRRGPGRIPAPSEALRHDVARIARLARERGLRSLLVVDDAVDSGATLGCVVGALRDALPEGTRLRSAVLAQTRPDPVFAPDFRLHEQVLCRFPWSFDFRGA